MRGLITVNLKDLGTYPNDNDKLIIAKRGFMISGSTYFSSLDGIGSNIHVVGYTWLHGYSLISNSIDFGSKIVNKVITAVLLANVNKSLCLIFCSFCHCIE